MEMEMYWIFVWVSASALVFGAFALIYAGLVNFINWALSRAEAMCGFEQGDLGREAPARPRADRYPISERLGNWADALFLVATFVPAFAKEIFSRLFNFSCSGCHMFSLSIRNGKCPVCQKKKK